MHHARCYILLLIDVTCGHNHCSFRHLWTRSSVLHRLVFSVRSMRLSRFIQCTALQRCISIDGAGNRAGESDDFQHDMTCQLAWQCCLTRHSRQLFRGACSAHLGILAKMMLKVLCSTWVQHHVTTLSWDSVRPGLPEAPMG